MQTEHGGRKEAVDLEMKHGCPFRLKKRLRGSPAWPFGFFLEFLLDVVTDSFLRRGTRDAVRETVARGHSSGTPEMTLYEWPLEDTQFFFFSAEIFGKQPQHFCLLGNFNLLSTDSF